jgi:hypothetical protein
MFGRTFSFWRRWAGRPGSEESTTGTAEADRRVWLRYHVNLETTLLPPSRASRFVARLRDISRGGVNLITDRPFQLGDHVSIELPAPEGQTHHVLACIVRTSRQADGEWALGCSFSRELSDEDLESFGARREKHPAPDQRTWIRFPCEIQASYQIVGTEGIPYSAQVENISASGIALIGDEPLETGVLLTLELQSAGSAATVILACVVHAAPQSGRWVLGCSFIRELSEEDLQVLIDK